jgi:glycosyltransferase involved in cell wall biosynthesis
MNVHYAASDVPLISIILPTCNRAHLLPRAILSVLKQTYDNFELIIIDDASTDETRQVIGTFEDARLRYIHHKHNLGAASARNTGIRAAQGTYIAFQDSDDEWLPEKLARQLTLLDNSSENTGLIYTYYRLIREDGRGTICPSRLQRWLRSLPLNVYHKGQDVYLALAQGNFITTQSVLMKKACFNKIGMFDKRLSRFQDWDLWLRLAQHYEFAHVPQPLVNVYVTEGSLSTNLDAFWDALEIILHKHKDQGRAGQALRRHYQFATGDVMCQTGNYEEGKQRLWRAARQSPFNLTYWEAAFFTLFGEAFYKMMMARLKIGYVIR